VPAGPDETTQADTEWPVAEQYRITPEPNYEQGREDERGALVVESSHPARPRGVPTAVVAAAVLSLVLLVGVAAAWLVVRSDDSTASSAGRGSPGQAPTTTPGNGAGTSSTTGSTSTTSTTDSSTTTNVIDVPSVVGLQVREAREKLRDLKLTPRTRLRSSTRAPGTVLDQQPDAGSTLDPGSVVVLDVAKRRPPAAPATVTVPLLVGTTAASAKTRLSSLGLHWSVVMRASERMRGIVLAQSPAAGAKLEKRRTVTLTVSSGPAQVSVPDVTGLDADSARVKLENAGFDVAVVDQPTSDPDQDGVVVDQDPLGGTEADNGSTVTITVARLS
jgi:hypothetical protein